MRTSFTLFALATLCCWAAQPVMADSVTDLTSTGSDGNLLNVLLAQVPYWGTSYVLNVDNGNLYAGGYYADGSVAVTSGPLATFGVSSATQTDGPNVNV